MSFTVKGKIKEILAPKSGTTKKGDTWTSQEVVITTDEQYPKEIVINFRDKTLEYLGTPKVGDTLDVEFNIKANQWQDRWFNSVEAWKVTVTANTSPF